MKKNLNELFGAKVKEYRIKKGLTQEMLAELAETEQKHISDVERGKSFLSSSLLEKIATALAVEPKDLFEFYHLQDTKILKKDIVSLLDKIKPEELPLVYKFIRTFVL